MHFPSATHVSAAVKLPVRLLLELAELLAVLLTLPLLLELADWLAVEL